MSLECSLVKTGTLIVAVVAMIKDVQEHFVSMVNHFVHIIYMLHLFNTLIVAPGKHFVIIM
jgi:hypothetical protein